MYMESIGDVLNEKVQENKAIKGKVLGFVQIPRWLVFSTEFSCYEKCVFSILVAFQMKKDKCWPSQETIAHKVPCSISTVKKTLGSLIAKGWVAKTHEKGKKSNVYYVKKLVVAKKPAY